MNSYHRGFSAVATAVIAAVVIAGGAVAMSMSGGADTETDTETDATSSAQSDMAASSSAMTNFSCDDQKSATLSFASSGDTELTLPSGEVRAVTRVETSNGAQFQSTDGSVTLRNTADQGVVIEQGDTVIAAGCVSVAGGEDTVDADMSTENEVDAAVETETNTSVDANATTATGQETEADVEADVEVQAESDMDIRSQ